MYNLRQKLVDNCQANDSDFLFSSFHSTRGKSEDARIRLILIAGQNRDAIDPLNWNRICSIVGEYIYIYIYDL